MRNKIALSDGNVCVDAVGYLILQSLYFSLPLSPPKYNDPVSCLWHHIGSTFKHLKIEYCVYSSPR